MSDKIPEQERSNKIIIIATFVLVVTLMGVIALANRSEDSPVADSFQSNQGIAIDGITSTPEQIVNSEKSSEITYFYGSTCPYCTYVEEFIEKEGAEERIPLVIKEIYGNTDNSEEMIRAAESCGLDVRSVGVPFLFSGGKCFVGSPDVIAELEQQIALYEADQEMISE
jgi:glutaredoxin